MRRPVLTDEQLRTYEVLARIKMATVALWFLLVIFAAFSGAFLLAIFLLPSDVPAKAILGGIDGGLGSLLHIVYRYLFPRQAKHAAAKSNSRASAIERGSRRIVIVLSLLIIAGGIALDAVLVWPRATVQVRLRDGRELILERQQPQAALLTDRASVQRDTGVGLGECQERQDLKVGGFTPMDCAGDVVDVRLVRGPYYRWWTDAQVTMLALAIAAALWGTFYVVRWIVRGFAKTPA